MTLMEPSSLIFLTLISKLQSCTVAICLSTKYPWPPFPESKPLDCIECKILTHCRSSINPPPPLRMRPQTPPFLLKKNENCRKIIKVPLHGHETFGAIHTIQHHCIKHCSRCRRRGYYNGLNREAPPERGTFFRLQVHEREGVFIVEVYERDQNEISHRCILWMWETRKPVLAIYSYCKDGVFTAVKKGCSVQN